jgi:hypothetical protein
LGGAALSSRGVLASWSTPPAEITFAAAGVIDLNPAWIARAIFKTREVVPGAAPDTATRPRGIVALTTSIGWRVLADVPGRELVMAAVTQP